jgi:hypothetical protein
METQTHTEVPAAEELASLCTQIRQLLAGGNVNCHRIGESYNYAVSKKLAERAKQKSALVYFCKNIKNLSRATLVMYGAVARAFDAETCAQYGMTALSLLLTYAEASGGTLNRADPSTAIILVPDSEGAVDEKFFGECSVADLRKALLRLRKPTSTAPLPADTLARVQQCDAVLTGYFPKEDGVRVEVRNLKGKAVIHLKDIPLEKMEQLTALLSAHLRPSAPMRPEIRS